MNIDDVDGEVTIKNIFDMFNKQKQLMSKYDKIEAALGATVPEPPYSLDSRAVQYRLKDLFWRVTEELAEAMEATESIGRPRLEDWRTLWSTRPYIRHYFEELADALHFLVEATVISNKPAGEIEMVFANRVAPPLDSVSGLHWEIVYRLGIAANCLKNKPWKQTEVPTDCLKYDSYLTEAWKCLRDLFTKLGFELSDILYLYEKKNVVNSWRQDTQY